MLLADAARTPAAGRPARWSSGTSPTGRTGPPASPCSAAWSRRTSGRARSRRARTRSRSWSSMIGSAYRSGGLHCEPSGQARVGGAAGRPGRGAAGPASLRSRDRPDRRSRQARPSADALQGAAARAVRLDRAALGARQPGRRHRHRRLRLRPGARPLAAGARHAGAARGRARLQHHRHRLVVRRDVRPAARAAQPAARRPARHRPLGADRLPGAAGPRGRPTPTPPAACGASLGDRADDYTTALSADDLAAVIDALGLGPVDVYGDSYGTFFAQVFAGRHPELVRSVVLDSAYPAYGETAWYPTQGPAMTRVLRRRLPALARPAATPAGRSCRPLRAVLAEVRDEALARDGLRRGRPPDAGPRRRPGPGRRRLRRDVHAGVLPRAHRRAALRRSPATAAAAAAGRRGHRRRHRRRTGRAYSEGLDAAVACHDYPQLYDMTAPPGRAPAAVRRRARRARRPTRTPTGRSRSTSTPTPTGRRWTGARSGRRRRASQPGRPAGAAGRPLPRRPGAGAQRRARLDHHRRPRATWSPASSRTPGTWWSPTASTSPRSATPTTARCGSCGRSSRRPPRRPSAAAALRRGVAPVRALGRFPARSPVPAAGAAGRALAALTVADLPGPLVEQLQRPRRRPARRHLALHRRRGGPFRLEASGWSAVSPSPARAVWDRVRRDHDASPRPARRATSRGTWDTRPPAPAPYSPGRLDGRPRPGGLPRPLTGSAPADSPSRLCRSRPAAYWPTQADGLSLQRRLVEDPPATSLADGAPQVARLA